MASSRAWFFSVSTISRIRKAQAMRAYDWLEVGEVRSGSVQGSQKVKNGGTSVPTKQAVIRDFDRKPVHHKDALLRWDPLAFITRHSYQGCQKLWREDYEKRSAVKLNCFHNNTKAHSIRLRQWVHKERHFLFVCLWFTSEMVYQLD